MPNETKLSDRLIAVHNAIEIPNRFGRSHKIAAYVIVSGQLLEGDLKCLTARRGQVEYSMRNGLFDHDADGNTWIRAIFIRNSRTFDDQPDSGEESNKIKIRPRPVIEIDFTFSIEIENDGISEISAPVLPIEIDPCES